MEGAPEPPELRGIIPNAFLHIFEKVALAKAGQQFLVRASYLEIYNEEVAIQQRGHGWNITDGTSTMAVQSSFLLYGGCIFTLPKQLVLESKFWSGAPSIRCLLPHHSPFWWCVCRSATSWRRIRRTPWS
jgi:hypothetical protein